MQDNELVGKNLTAIDSTNTITTTDTYTPEASTVTSFYQTIADKILTDKPNMPSLPSPFTSISFADIAHVPLKPRCGTLLCIDGGNGEIIGNNNISFNLMRIFYAHYVDNTRVKTEQNDYYVFIANATASEYSVEVYNTKGTLCEQFSLERVKDGNLLRPEAVVSIVRRVYELRIALKAVKTMTLSETTVLIDGTLETKHPLEHSALHELFEFCAQHHVALLGIAKTSSYSTDSGSNLVGYLHTRQPHDSWYAIVGTSSSLRLVVAKFHPLSKHAFLVWVPASLSETDMATAFGAVAYNSRDPVFLGYPHGLVHADSIARCTEEELSIHKMRFLSGQKSLNMQRILATNKAHAVLDSLR